jgi:glycosyltransferase involved in cell wall biosynthesis
VILSAGRLVWEKGHQDVVRALALLRRDGSDARVVILGRGPEEERLRRYTSELGVSELVRFRPFTPYEEMPEVYNGAACLVLGSLPLWSWEEQFGMVLAEAMASALPVVASTSGAIPEVAGPSASYFAPGDWVGLAATLREVLARPRPTAPVDPERVAHFSVRSAAERLADAYERLLA